MVLVNDENKRRFKRGFKRRHKNALVLSQQADQQIEKLLIRRFDRLISVRRFIFLWVSLFLILISCGLLQLRALSAHYQTLKPVPGGLYHEGMIGTFTNANPIFASGSANVAVSRLVFSGLFRYDDSNALVGDLAQKYELSTNQKRYLVHLKPNIRWHDGKPFTADDVIFTYKSIQNIESQSSLYSSWKDITVSKLDGDTVIFDLPNPLSAFPYSMTNGIIPAHLLKNIPAVQLRSAAFNTSPVGTGPFEWRFVEVVGKATIDREQRISLSANDDYHGGEPKLDGFNLITFTNDEKLIQAFKNKQINAMSGLEKLPEGMEKDSNIQTNVTPLSGIVMSFFNNSKPILGDANVRKALVSAVDRKNILELFDFPTYPAQGPLLSGQLGYDPALGQLPFDEAKANQLLDQAGWLRGEGGVRTKGSQQLVLNLRSQESQEYTKVAQALQRYWGRVGAKVSVHYYNNDDLQTSVISNHDYDILLYGISIGVDPDVFAYWHSSQASVSSQGRLNLSEYKSTAADQALEAARTRADPAVRIPKYQSFTSTWVGDAPAQALYQPNYLYISHGQVFNYSRKSANSGVDRYYEVHNWMIRQQKQTIK